MPSDGFLSRGRTRLRFVSHSFAPADAPLSNVGGMQRVAMELASALSARDDLEVRLDVLRARWDRIALHAPLFLSALPARLVRDASGSDAVLFSSMTSAAAALPSFASLRRSGVTIAAIAHGLDVTHPNPAYQLAVRSVMPRLDRVFPVSRATSERCAERGARVIDVIPNGVDVGRFASLQRRERRADDRFTVLAVGRHVQRKGFGWFVSEVMPRLDERIRFVLVGDGPEREAIEHLVVELGLEHRVRMTGIVPEATLVDEFARADVLVMPNLEVEGDMEGFGIVLLEAAAASLPVIASDLEGMRDVVRHDATGWLEPSRDAAAFAARVHALASTPDEGARVGAAGRALVRDRFGWAAIASRYVTSLESARAAR